MCQFLVNNPHFITILTALSDPTEKINKELNATDIEFFPRKSPASDFFYKLKSLLVTLDLTQLRVNSL